jgi:hypothetical protein
MAQREWQQLELRLPIAGDVAVVYETSPTSAPHRKASRPEVSLLGNAALLAEVLGHSTEPACDTLTTAYGSLRRLSQAHPPDLRVGRGGA